MYQKLIWSFFTFRRSSCINNHCPYNNAIRNLYNAGRHFVTFLLPHGAPLLLQPIIDKVVDGYTNLTMPSKHLLKTLNKIKQLYQTGWYMNRTKPEDSATSMFDPSPSHDTHTNTHTHAPALFYSDVTLPMTTTYCEWVHHVFQSFHHKTITFASLENEPLQKWVCC